MESMATDDMREIQTRRLWNLGFGRELKVKDYETYLESIPAVPASLVGEDTDLPLLSLADPRPGLMRSCTFLGIVYEQRGYSDSSATEPDPDFPLPAMPFWFRHDDATATRSYVPTRCLDKLVGDMLVGTAMEGIFAFIHHPFILVEDKNLLDLPRTVNRVEPLYIACLWVKQGQAELSLYARSDFPSPISGVLRVRRK